MPPILRLASLCITIVLALTTVASAQEKEEAEYEGSFTVERIVDGDTIRIDPAVDGIDEVRLIGVDTPETKDSDCDMQPYGPEGLMFTRDELQGEEVDLEFDEDREDRYERLLAYVYLDDEMFNERLLEEGYAQVYTVPPNDRYEDRFEEAQEAAQEAELGIWGVSSSEQALLADRGNGIGGEEECSQRANQTPPRTPPAPAQPPPTKSAPTPTTDVPDPDVPTPEVSPPAQPTPSSGAATPTGGSCPPDSPIKGNHSSSGELIYHVPGGQFYSRTNPEECFATEAEAQSAGYRASQR
jgi:micrococcal nuclease